MFKMGQEYTTSVFTQVGMYARAHKDTHYNTYKANGWLEWDN